MKFFLILMTLVIFAGCDQKQQVRTYTEKATEVPVVASNDPHAGMDMGQDPHAGLDMSAAGSMGVGPVMGMDSSSSTMDWKVPEGWKEEPAKGLRLATFKDAGNPQDIDVSIVPLGGSIAGGLESNLKRWMGQINLKAPDSELQTFMQSSPNNIYDFTQLQKGQDNSTKSMMVAVITLSDKTVFVKMTGSIVSVQRQKAKFLELVKSVHSKETSSQEASMGMQDPHAGLDMKDPHAGLDMSSMNMMAGPASTSLKWQVPQEWKEEPASGMRLATFHDSTDPKKIDCYIVTLGGMAGGVEANLGRWLGQFGATASAENIKKVMDASQSVKTPDGLEAKIYDLTPIQGSSASDKSMIAAIIPTQEASIFVKMTGRIDAVRQNKGSFIELVKSIHQ